MIEDAKNTELSGFTTVKKLYKQQIIPMGMNKLYELVEREDFPKLVIGNRIYIPKKPLDDWINNSWKSSQNK